jgi:hypothetical protein
VREVAVLFAGDDWSEDHRDVEVQDRSGRVLGRARLGEGVAGMARFHELIGRFADPGGGPGQVVIGIETGRGPWVAICSEAGRVTSGSIGGIPFTRRCHKHRRCSRHYRAQ